MKIAVSRFLYADDTSFEQTIRDHQAMVFSTLVRLTGSRENVEDLAQEVFLRLYRALPGFRGEALLTTYLYRIVANVAQDEWKRRRRQDRPLVSFSDEDSAWEDRLAHPGPDAEKQFAEHQFRYSVEEQLQKLSPIERTILVLYHQEERTYEQIAQSLRLPIGTVRTHLHRGRQKLRQGLERDRFKRQQPLAKEPLWQKTK